MRVLGCSCRLLLSQNSPINPKLKMRWEFPHYRLFLYLNPFHSLPLLSSGDQEQSPDSCLYVTLAGPSLTPPLCLSLSLYSPLYLLRTLSTPPAYPKHSPYWGLSILAVLGRCTHRASTLSPSAHPQWLLCLASCPAPLPPLTPSTPCLPHPSVLNSIISVITEPDQPVLIIKERMGLYASAHYIT